MDQFMSLHQLLQYLPGNWILKHLEDVSAPSKIRNCLLSSLPLELQTFECTTGRFIAYATGALRQCQDVVFFFSQLMATADCTKRKKEKSIFLSLPFCLCLDILRA